MVRELVALRAHLWWNGMKRSTLTLIATIILAAYGLFVAMGLLGGSLYVAGRVDVEEIAFIATILGLILVLGWWLVPLFAFGSDASLSPDRFVTYPVRGRTLLWGSTLASFIGVPGLATVVASLGFVLIWWQSPAYMPLALLGAVGGLLMAALGARVVSVVATPFISSRRYREMMVVLIIIPLALLGPIMEWMRQGISGNFTMMERAVEVMGWTPIGAIFAYPGDFVAGQWWLGLLRLVIYALGVWVLLKVWDWALPWSLYRTSRRSSAAAHSGLGPLGWAALQPAGLERFGLGQVGAIAARCLIYWWRDPRYSANIIVAPLLPVILAMVNPQLLLLAGPIVAFMFMWTVSTDVGLDATAFWMHLAAPLRGWQDRAGRVLAVSIIAIPAILLVSLGGLAYWDIAHEIGGLQNLEFIGEVRWERLQWFGWLAGAGSIGIGLAAAGVASVLSALLVYPMTKPGDNPFSSPQGSSLATLLSQSAGWAVLVVLVGPGVALSYFGYAQESYALMLAGGWVLLLTGIAVVLGGIKLGGTVLDNRAPALLAKLRSYGR